MGMINDRLRSVQGCHFAFWCPGCEHVHQVGTGWTWNGDSERPTVQPSLLVRNGHFLEGHEGSCWCTFYAERPEEPVAFKCRRCHTFITNGEIQYLGDCSHALAGQTVPIPPLPPHLRDSED